MQEASGELEPWRFVGLCSRRLKIAITQEPHDSRAIRSASPRIPEPPERLGRPLCRCRGSRRRLCPFRRLRDRQRDQPAPDQRPAPAAGRDRVLVGEDVACNDKASRSVISSSNLEGTQDWKPFVTSRRVPPNPPPFHINPLVLAR